jgi:hypothetical protein
VNALSAASLSTISLVLYLRGRLQSLYTLSSMDGIWSRIFGLGHPFSYSLMLVLFYSSWCMLSPFPISSLGSYKLPNLLCRQAPVLGTAYSASRIRTGRLLVSLFFHINYMHKIWRWCRLVNANIYVPGMSSASCTT